MQGQYHSVNQSSQSAPNHFAYSNNVQPYSDVDSVSLHKLESELSSGLVKCYVVWLYFTAILCIFSLISFAIFPYHGNKTDLVSTILYTLLDLALCWVGITAVKEKSLTKANINFFATYAGWIILLLSLLGVVIVRFTFKWEDDVVKHSLTGFIIVMSVVSLLFYVLNVRGATKVRDILNKMNQLQLSAPNMA